MRCNDETFSATQKLDFLRSRQSSKRQKIDDKDRSKQAVIALDTPVLRQVLK